MMQAIDDYDALRGAKYLLNMKGIEWNEPLSVFNFARFREYTADCVKYCLTSDDYENHTWIPDWAPVFARFGDEFDFKIAQDPLLLYQPRTEKHAAFHRSTAYIRYLLAANGIGKTLLAYVEDIWCATGQKHWRNRRGNVVVVSTGHSVYSEKVFLTKMLHGEDGDPYSPYLPEGGKWLHSYDERKYLLRIACQHCAENNLTKKCEHLKTIHCLSADSGVERIMGFTARLYHMDEHVPKEIAKELHQRARRGGADGRGILSATPLAGPDSWEIQDLYNLATETPEKNYLSTDHKDVKYVEIFQISKYDCVGTVNGPTLGEIEADRLKMPDSEFRARVLGEPVPIADNPVFDLNALDIQEKVNSQIPRYFTIGIRKVPNRDTLLDVAATSVEALTEARDIMIEEVKPPKPKEFSGLRIWELPQKGARYAIGADSALGVGASSEKKDASYAPVYKIITLPNLGALVLEQVAAWWGKKFDIYEYAKQLKMLGFLYNRACIIPETTGIGGVLTTDLTRQLHYPSVFVSENDGSKIDADISSNFGVHTNSETKPKIVAAAFSFIKDNSIILRDKEAISEFRTFQQITQVNKTTNAVTHKYEAARGAKDDRVMGTALVCYAIRNNPIIVLSLSQPPPDKPNPDKLNHNISTRSGRLNRIKRRYV